MIDNDEKKRMMLFQDNLGLIRKSIGWTEDDLAEKLDVSRQTISNLERKINKMSRIQYIAIRALLNEEIREALKNEKEKDNPKDTDLLVCILRLLVDEEENYDEEEKNQIRSMANILTPAIIVKKESKKEVSKILRNVGIAVATIATVTAGIWFSKGNNNNK